MCTKEYEKYGEKPDPKPARMSKAWFIMVL